MLIEKIAKRKQKKRSMKAKAKRGPAKAKSKKTAAESMQRFGALLVIQLKTNLLVN